jgi:hypothetical protein
MDLHLKRMNPSEEQSMIACQERCICGGSDGKPQLE